MYKIIITILLTLVLTACGEDNTNNTKKSHVDKQQDKQCDIIIQQKLKSALGNQYQYLQSPPDPRKFNNTTSMKALTQEANTITLHMNAEIAKTKFLEQDIKSNNNACLRKEANEIAIYYFSDNQPDKATPFFILAQQK